MAEDLKRRIDNAIKNHWNSRVKKRMQDFNEKLQNIE
ncbi:unnamed protein product [Paramecium primaurelia]|uniref:HTH myb-type domain-containing protein n=1 Tax=Paramecium primaurelia TaxID=5886 RepID=A0A8S1JQ92_PARPR|nr:unnamed protein product [Paramecium primaurelia]